MSSLARYLERRATVHGPWSPQSGDPVLVRLFGGSDTHAGVEVTETSAIGWTALASGIRWLSETIASLPLRVYERTELRGREMLRGSPLWRLLHDEPNPEMTSYEWRDLSMTHAVLWGNAYSLIVFDGGGIPIELWPLNPDRVRMERDRAGNVVYVVSNPSSATDPGSVASVIPADEMLHIRGFSRYGLLGERMIDTYKEAIGLGLATQQFAAALFGSGLNAGGIVEHPAALSEEAKQRIAKSLERQVGGLSRAHRTLVLEEGMKWHQTTIEPEKAQFLQTRLFQVGEASRILRIPPHLLYDLSHATYTNIEAQGLEVLIYTLTSWLVRWEQRLMKQLVSTKSRNRIFIKFGVEGLLRGDTQSRYNAYATGRQWGWLSANDVRELEDMNPRPRGDTYLEPLNMNVVGPGTPTPPSEPPAPPPPPAGGNGDQPPPEGNRSHASHRLAQHLDV